MRSFYNFIRGAFGLGVGVQNFAYERNQSTPVDGYAPGNHFVRNSLAPISPAAVKLGQTVVPVSILGDHGAAVPGQLDLSPLGQPVKRG